MRAIVPVVLTVALLAGCAGSPGPDPDATDPRPPGVQEPDDCLVGTWNLDVPAYAAESEAYLLGLGIPIVGFAMGGAGTLTFTADGLVSVDIALQTTGTLVAGDQSIPIDVPSGYTATGDWSRTGDETVQFDNWAKLTEAPASDVDVPAPDYTQLADVEATCTAGELYLAAPGAPIGATWVR
jgi:hypothetical protein